MVEKTNPGEVTAFNKNGTTKFSKIAWSRMKVLPDGSRLGGWRELLPGMDVKQMIASSNVPEALKATRPLAGPAPAPINWSKEEKESMIEDAVADRVGKELDKFHAGYQSQTNVLDKLSAYILAKHSDKVNPEGDLADTVIGVLDGVKEALESANGKVTELTAIQDELGNIRKYADENGIQLPEGQSISESIILLLQSKSNHNPAATSDESSVNDGKKTSGKAKNA